MSGGGGGVTKKDDKKKYRGKKKKLKDQKGSSRDTKFVEYGSESSIHRGT